MEHAVLHASIGVPMSVDTDGPIHTKVYATTDGRTVIEQSTSTVVFQSAEQILAVIKELRACYDYCAAWKESTNEKDDAVNTEL